MKIETFQKIEQRLINATLLPVSIFITISIYFWESLWDRHIILTIIAFIASLASCLYFLSVNISQRPVKFLKELYTNNKKYKTLRTVQQDQQKISIKEGLSPKKQQGQKEKEISKPHQQPKHGHFSFHEQDDTQAQSPSVPLKQQKQQPKKQFKVQSDSKKPQKYVKSTSRYSSNELDALQLLNYSPLQSKNQKSKKPKRKYSSDQLFESKQQEQFLKESQQLKKCLQNIVGQTDTEESVRKEYENRYQSYKKSLQEFSFNRQDMEKLMGQTKMIIRQKIQENLKKQFENLDSIESILRKNFSINFKSYKEKSQHQKNPLSQRSNHSYTYQNQSHSALNQALNPALKFSQVLQQCVNLLHNHYFNFQFTGQIQKIDEIKNQIKSLIQQRIQLDEFLFLKRPLNMSKNYTKKVQKISFKSQFQEERYLNLMRLKNLAHILGQRKSAQQNLLKQFFSSYRSFVSQGGETVEQINDERNSQFLVQFMVHVFQQKLSNANASDHIQVQLSKPNFSNASINHIWVTKSMDRKSHYDIAYSFKVNKENKSSNQIKPSLGTDTEKDKKKEPMQMIYCCPGETNIWTCFVFIRQLIAKIGLKKQKYPNIKNKELQKDVQRLIELFN